MTWGGSNAVDKSGCCNAMMPDASSAAAGSPACNFFCTLRVVRVLLLLHSHPLRTFSVVVLRILSLSPRRRRSKWSMQLLMLECSLYWFLLQVLRCRPLAYIRSDFSRQR